jgi:hypothetical protein
MSRVLRGGGRGDEQCHKAARPQKEGLGHRGAILIGGRHVKGRPL